MAKKFTPKQQKFIDLFAGDGAATARAAGYSEKTARTIASRLLGNPAIINAIKNRRKNESKEKAERLKNEPDGIEAAIEQYIPEREKRIASREERQAFWTSVMDGQEQDVIVKDGKKVKVEVQMKDRLKASELLGRSEADFTEKIQGDMDITVVRKEYKTK